MSTDRVDQCKRNDIIRYDQFTAVNSGLWTVIVQLGFVIWMRFKTHDPTQTDGWMLFMNYAAPSHPQRSFSGLSDQGSAK